jgi:hypothetical protein
VGGGVLGACPGAVIRAHRRWCRTARAGLRLTRGQRRRLIGLLISAGDVWACVLELNGWRRAWQARPLASCQELCRVLAASGPGVFGELDTTGARSVLRCYADAWFAAARRRRGRRRHGAVSAAPPADGAGALGITVRSAWTGGRWRFRCPAAARRCGSAWTATCPTPPGRSARPSCCSTRGRLWLEVTAEVPVAGYPAGQEPDPGRVAGVDLGIIHPYAVAGPGAQGLLVSGRPDHTFRVCPRPGVTRAAALITAAPAGPLAGTGPPRPPPQGAGGESLASPRGPRKHPTNLRRGALG